MNEIQAFINNGII